MVNEDRRARHRHRRGREAEHPRQAVHEHTVNGGASAMDNGKGTHLKNEDTHVNDIEREVALDTSPSSSMREIHQVAGEPIVEFRVPRDALPDGESAIERDQVDEDVAVELRGLVTLDEGAAKARQPALPMGRWDGILVRADRKAHLGRRKMLAYGLWRQHAARVVVTFTNHDFGIRSVDREGQVVGS